MYQWIYILIQLKCISLLEKLDGRSYNEEKIRKILKIETLDNFYDFILQTTDHNIFNTEIKNDLRGRLLELFLRSTHNSYLTM